TITYVVSLRCPVRVTLSPYTTLFRSFGQRRRRTASGRCCARQSIRRLQGSRHAADRAPGGEEHQKRDVILAVAVSIGEHSTGRRSEEHTSELQSRVDLVCRLLLEKKK